MQLKERNRSAILKYNIPADTAPTKKIPEHSKMIEKR